LWNQFKNYIRRGTRSKIRRKAEETNPDALDVEEEPVEPVEPVVDLVVVLDEDEDEDEDEVVVVV